MAFKDEVKRQLFDSIPKGFVDPVTMRYPSSETQLSAVLCYYHLMGRVDWNSIRLYSMDNTFSGKTADEIISTSEPLCCEYPLFASTEQVRIWGQMSADLLSYSKDKERVTLIENKIGSNFTSGGGDPCTGQLARQIEYLIQSNVKDKNIVLLSAKQFFDKYWYSTELLNTLDHKDARELVAGHLIYWEEVFSAIK